jgi:hypothetical protein
MDIYNYRLMTMIIPPLWQHIAYYDNDDMSSGNNVTRNNNKETKKELLHKLRVRIGLNTVTYRCSDNVIIWYIVSTINVVNAIIYV